MESEMQAYQAHWEYHIDPQLIVFTSSGQVQSLRGSINLSLAFLAKCEQGAASWDMLYFPTHVRLLHLAWLLNGLASIHRLGRAICSLLWR